MDQSSPFSRLAGRHVRPWFWVVLSLLCLATDYASGPSIQFPVAYLAPVSLAAWYGGRCWGLSLAVILPLSRLYFIIIWDTPLTMVEASINAAIRITVFAAFAWLVDRIARQMRELRHMHLLEGILGVCAVCKKIRDDRVDTWESLDAYIAAHPAEFKRDVCPSCATENRDVFDRR